MCRRWEWTLRPQATSEVRGQRAGSPTPCTFQLSRDFRDSIVAEQQEFEARQLGEALQLDDAVVRQIYAIELVLQTKGPA
jgi:hypothetical protein